MTQRRLKVSVFNNPATYLNPILTNPDCYFRGAPFGFPSRLQTALVIRPSTHITAAVALLVLDFGRTRQAKVAFYRSFQPYL
jgi:hypothetical protein